MSRQLFRGSAGEYQADEQHVCAQIQSQAKDQESKKTMIKTPPTKLLPTWIQKGRAYGLQGAGQEKTE